MLIPCLDPIIIINPGIYDCVAYSHYIISNDDKITFNNVSSLFKHTLYVALKNLRNQITTENIENYYSINQFNDKVYCFLLVPCRHCILCQQKDENELSQRLQFESDQYAVEPYFLTLTYANWSLPSDGLPHKKHIQLYIKRLRNYAKDIYNSEIRFYAQGELGEKTNRPHYHLIIWGLPQLSVAERENFFSLAWRTNKIYTHLVRGQVVRDRLPIGHIHVRQINEQSYRNFYKQKFGIDLNPSDGLRYCCKYNTKNTSPCRTWSKGLGKKTIMQYRTYMLNIANCKSLKPNWSLFHKNKYGQYVPVIMSRWFLQSVFKTYNRSTYYYRSRFNRLIKYLSRTKYFDLLIDDLQKYADLIHINLLSLPVRYLQRSFSNYIEKYAQTPNYQKIIKSCKNTKFLRNFNEHFFSKYKYEQMLYSNFVKMYFSNKTFTIDDLQRKLFERKKYLNKSYQLCTL